jgi:hypothetical protein
MLRRLTTTAHIPLVRAFAATAVTRQGFLVWKVGGDGNKQCVGSFESSSLAEAERDRLARSSDADKMKYFVAPDGALDADIENEAPMQTGRVLRPGPRDVPDQFKA